MIVSGVRRFFSTSELSAWITLRSHAGDVGKQRGLNNFPIPSGREFSGQAFFLSATSFSWWYSSKNICCLRSSLADLCKPSGAGQRHAVIIIANLL